MSALLTVQNLHVTYGNGVKALQGVSFSADPGEIIGIIGRSGAGKSTLLRTLNGLQPVTTGSIVLNGTEITTLPHQQRLRLRRQIGFIWQEYNLIERLSVMTNVLCGRLGYNAWWKSAVHFFDASHRQLAIDNLRRVDLLDKARQRADQCSGGEKQRVAIARALTQQPTILLADEPIASLDPALAVQVLGDLARIAREVGVLTLINLHRIDLAKQFCDRIIGIKSGQLLFDGTPDALTDAVQSELFSHA